MEKSLYQHLGGEAGVRKLVDRFYDLMDTLPETKSLRAVHPDSLSGSADKLFAFMSGWTGGPALFHQRHGNPMLRARHLPFKIGKPERDQWMLCMVLAIEELGLPDTVRELLIENLMRLADHMRNQSEPPT